MRKLIPTILIMCLVFSTSVISFGETRTSNSLTEVSKEELATLNKYNLCDQSTGFFSIDKFLEKCTIVEKDDELDSIRYKLVEDTDFSEVCDKINDIEVFNNILYIHYTAADGADVTISICDDYFNDMAVYDAEADVAYSISDTYNIKYIDFMEGNNYKMSNELQTLIESYVENDDYEGLCKIPNIRVVEKKVNII